MSPDALRYRLNELGLTQGGLARLLDVNPRTVRRWCAGTQDVTEGLESRLAEVTEDEVCEAMAKGHGSPKEALMQMDRYVAQRRRGTR